MKCAIPEISWHNREPVLSVDIHPVCTDFYRLATGGADCFVVIWQMVIGENGGVKQELVSELTRHQRSVNVVRWSPNGQYLASADDDANIIIWQQKTDNIPVLDEESDGKEVWMSYKVLRGHKEDIYDLCWSPDGLKLLTGSVDNTAILWDFNKGKSECILTDHKGFVQGVSWDPKGEYLATISTDRTLRIYDKNAKHVKARVSKGQLPTPADHYLHGKEVKYFHDDTFKSFFRRLEFTPDGTLLIVPSGKIETEDSKKVLYATYIFAVEDWAMPAVVLPNLKRPSSVVRVCPVLFELRDIGPDPAIVLPYRMVFAIGTDRDILLYDTQQIEPFALLRDVHYTRLTDLTWSNDGRLLIASSTDGFCSLITFDLNDLGVPYVKEDSETEDNALDISGCEELEEMKEPKEDVGKAKEIEVSKPKRSFLEEWAAKNTPKKKKLDMENDDQDGETSKTMEVIEVEVEALNTANCDGQTSSREKAPKRITPVPVKENITNGKTVPEAKDMSPSIKKRITPISLKEQTNQSKNKNTVAQPIAVRRKPKNVEPVSEENKQKDGKKEQVAQPIAVRRKPRTEDVNNEAKEESTSNNKPKEQVAQPIAVRRKSKDDENRNKQNTEDIEMEVDIKKIPNYNDGEMAVENVSLNQQPGNGSDKDEEPCTNEEMNTKFDIENEKASKSTRNAGQDKDYNEERDESKHNKSTDKNVKKLASQVPKSKQSPAQVKRKGKQKDKTPVTKKSRKSAENVSLLKFLKPSPKEKVKKTPAKVLFGNFENNECIVIQDEARDGWICEKITENLVPTNSKEDIPKKNSVTNEDDCTEDFSLQLEDSQQTSDGVCKKSTGSSGKPSGNEVIVIDDDSMEHSVDKNTGSEDISTQAGCSKSEDTSQMECDVNEISEAEKKDKENLLECSESEPAENQTEKLEVPEDNPQIILEKCKMQEASCKSINKVNRIPLITISSPKNRKKKET